MALRRRELLVGVPLLGLLGCSSSSSRRCSRRALRKLGRSVAAESLSCWCSCQMKQTREVDKGLKDELEGQFSIFACAVDGDRRAAGSPRR